MMTKAVVASITAMLAEVEETERVRVCFAVESGSRAWGFPSADSDYDVRFVYVHHPDWYLSIEDGRDVIERPLTNTIDLSGWDIRKSLKLFRKSNPPLLEWLQCPIVYMERAGFARALKDMLPRFYSPEASFHHYLHMASGNFREYLQGEVVWRKKYLYVLRPLLAMRWIEQGRGPVPIEFDRLREATLPDDELRRAIDDLVEEKVSGHELDQGPRVPIISDFIAQEMTRLEMREADHRPETPPRAELDRVFRRTLTEIWSVKGLVDI